MRIAGILLVALTATSGLSGCFKSKMVSCNQTNKDYAGAQEMPPLQAPPGLDAPNTRNALKVPPLNTPERVRGKDEPCLDIPPPFSSAKTAPKAAPTPAPAPAPAEAPKPPSSNN
jgi:uncharacterized lipoprotein